MTPRTGRSRVALAPGPALLAWGLLLLATTVAAAPPPWAYPGCPGGRPVPPADEVHSLPGTSVTFKTRETRDLSRVPDWFPGDHPAPLPRVLEGPAGGPIPCGFCHLADGGGRPENARIAGLPAPYIVAQVEALRDGTRAPGVPGWKPTALMVASLHDLDSETLADIARYFWELDLRPAVRVVESAVAPAHQDLCYSSEPRPGPPVALGTSIVELPDDVTRFELRDPHLAYTAYVPPGSIARGKALAEAGRPGKVPSCESCHGPELRGAMDLTGPPLAGRFPLYLVRQLMGFRDGTRGGTGAAAMRTVVATLSDEDFIDAAAYAASLKP